MPGKAHTPSGYIDKDSTPSTLDELGGQIANPLSAPLQALLHWAGAPEQSHKILVWSIVAVLFIVGVWGLVAPGGGVAVVERAAK